MKKLILILFSCLSLVVFSAAHADNKSEKNQSGSSFKSGKKSGKSQSGGLPALADEVAELRLMIEALQWQVGGSDDPYSGIYTVSLVENQIYGCGFTNDPAVLLGTPAFISYLQAQGISSSTTRVAYFDVAADGGQLIVPDYLISIQELRGSGRFESEVRAEDGSIVTIAADGSLLFDAGPESVFRGQMSADGSTFVAQVFGIFNEEECVDSYMVSMVGVRK